MGHSDNLFSVCIDVDRNRFDNLDLIAKKSINIKIERKVIYFEHEFDPIIFENSICFGGNLGYVQIIHNDGTLYLILPKDDVRFMLE